MCFRTADRTGAAVPQGGGKQSCLGIQEEGAKLLTGLSCLLIREGDPAVGFLRFFECRFRLEKVLLFQLEILFLQRKLTGALKLFLEFRQIDTRSFQKLKFGRSLLFPSLERIFFLLYVGKGQTGGFLLLFQKRALLLRVFLLLKESQRFFHPFPQSVVIFSLLFPLYLGLPFFFLKGGKTGFQPLFFLLLQKRPFFLVLLQMGKKIRQPGGCLDGVPAQISVLLRLRLILR